MRSKRKSVIKKEQMSSTNNGSNEEQYNQQLNQLMYSNPETTDWSSSESEFVGQQLSPDLSPHSNAEIGSTEWSSSVSQLPFQSSSSSTAQSFTGQWSSSSQLRNARSHHSSGTSRAQVLGSQTPSRRWQNKISSVVPFQGSGLSNQYSGTESRRQGYERRPNRIVQEVPATECKVCFGKGCGYFVCGCRGSAGGICMPCLEHIVRTRYRQQFINSENSNPMVCPDCKTRFFGVEIAREGTFQQITGMSTESIAICVLGPLIFCSTAILFFGITQGMSNIWVRVFAWLLLFIYIFEGLVFGYCFYNYRQDSRRFRGIRLTAQAIKIRSREEIRQLSSTLLNNLQKLQQSFNQKIQGNRANGPNI